MNRRMFWFDEADDAALEAIRQHFNVKTKAQAIRLSLRIALQANGLTIQKTKRRGVKASSHGGNFFGHMLALSNEVQVPGLPEDYAERLDDYLYGPMIEQ